MKITAFRYLRMKYGISLDELAKGISLSPQNLNHIELLDVAPTAHHEAMLSRALSGYLLHHRKMLDALEKDLQKYEGRLLEPAEEVDEYGI